MTLLGRTVAAFGTFPFTNSMEKVDGEKILSLPQLEAAMLLSTSCWESQKGRELVHLGAACIFPVGASSRLFLCEFSQANFLSTMLPGNPKAASSVFNIHEVKPGGGQARGGGVFVIAFVGTLTRVAFVPH